MAGLLRQGKGSTRDDGADLSGQEKAVQNHGESGDRLVESIFERVQWERWDL